MASELEVEVEDSECGEQAVLVLGAEAEAVEGGLSAENGFW